MGKAASGDERILGPRTITVVAEADDCPVCWICLDGPGPDRPLVHPCRCPSWCHAGCIARWQLQSAGTRRETHCDFCREALPDWKDVLTPNSDTTSAPAVMNVNFDHKTYSFTVAPGPEGYKQFTQAIRKAFHLPDDSELNITFTCDEPSSGSLLTLSGPGAYDAAVHCAAVSAARRSSLGGPEAGVGGPSGDGTTAPAGSGGDRAQVAAPGGARAHGLCPCPPRVRAPRASTSGGASTNSSPSPRSEAEDAAVARGFSTGALPQQQQQQPEGAGAAAAGGASNVRGGGGVSLGRKLRNALSDMLVIR
ncbi:hypothetical protein MNEG_10565 [Monoraphidium neglectum]|uniref:RING-CH-type domain-containing protein n=1 Tax=Monoraphidium neglectum TaxID=145388 RepID=A0A0D2KP18_9CHLO|nr:hypothetical protein MNEG_10565 [Monoraphidium neglectum]KIY97398.1 hypothetical protein MNEG_10565 [Monoraphidium neglectum]|eukprot:XP_013896418.1 hypothetical protein MNEG_10565 [Monoraphidium neglectum]